MSELFKALRVRLRTLIACEAGQGLTEYALILVLVAIVAILALTLISGGVWPPIRSAGNAI